MSAPDLDDLLVPLPKSEQPPEAVGELNWYDLDLRLTLRRHIRRMKKSAPAEAPRRPRARFGCWIARQSTRRLETFLETGNPPREKVNG
jgi:hypothetical protein